jgi:uncharacterized membrane protein YkvA (DUF1232 family)
VNRSEAIEIELNPRSQRLWDRVRSRVVSAPDEAGRSGVGDLVVLLPDLTVLLTRLLRDPRVAAADKLVALLGLGYVLLPVDLLPEIILGPIGLVDDLLVVSAALSRIVNHVHPDVVRSHWSGQGDVLHVVKRVTAWSERLVSDRARRLLRAVFGPLRG